MFRKNDEHNQLSMFNSYRALHPKIYEVFEDSWAPVFYEEVFNQIDEELFAFMYCEDNGRPNFPVNVLMSLEIIKHIFNYTDRELLNQFYFNYQVSYAVGVKNLGELYLARRTLYEFREKLYIHTANNPDAEDLIFKTFKELTDNFLEKANIDTKELRTDSTMVAPNIKKAGRLSLAYDVLKKAVLSTPEELLSEKLKHVPTQEFKKELLYYSKSESTEDLLKQVLELLVELKETVVGHEALMQQESIQLLERFLQEQGKEEGGEILPKDAKEVSTDSLQSAHDPDATYRNKSGKKHSGYSVNITETCSDENEHQFITDYTLSCNNKSDVEVIKERLDSWREETGAQKIYADGGYYSDDVVEKAETKGIELNYSQVTGKKDNNDKLDITNFQFNSNYEVMKCPDDKVPLKSQYKPKKGVSISHFAKEDCMNCQYRDICRVKEQKKNMVLRVTKKSLLAAKTKLHTKANRKEIASKRAPVEGTCSALKRSQNAGKLSVRGKAKSKVQMGLKIIGYNFKQFAKLCKSQNLSTGDVSLKPG